MTLEQLENIIKQQRADMEQLVTQKEELEAGLSQAVKANDHEQLRSLQSLLNKLNVDIKHKQLEIDSMRKQRQLGLF